SAMWINPATVIATSLLVGGTFMGTTALGLIAAREGDGDPRRRIAILTSAFGVGQILGPAFAGYVFDATGSFPLPSLAAPEGRGGWGWWGRRWWCCRDRLPTRPCVNALGMTLGGWQRSRAKLLQIRQRVLGSAHAGHVGRIQTVAVFRRFAGEEDAVVVRFGED